MNLMVAQVQHRFSGSPGSLLRVRMDMAIKLTAGGLRLEDIVPRLSQANDTPRRVHWSGARIISGEGIRIPIMHDDWEAELP